MHAQISKFIYSPDSPSVMPDEIPAYRLMGACRVTRCSFLLSFSTCESKGTSSFGAGACTLPASDRGLKLATDRAGIAWDQVQSTCARPGRVASGGGGVAREDRGAHAG